MQDTASINTRNGIIINGAPEGRNKLFNSHPCLVVPIMFTPIKCNREINNVTIKELVTVNEYGSKPTKFAKKIVKNK